MKIRDVQSHVLRPAAEVFGSAKGWHTVRQALLVEITTEDGLSGVGEAYGPAIVNKTIVDELYRPRLIGRDPLDTSVIWEDLYGTFRDYGRKGMPIASISAVDIALWDLKGKALGQPVYKLLGGPFRTRVRAYATGLYRHQVPDNASALAREAEGYAREGFRAMKMKVGFGIDEDTTNVRAVREAIGPDLGLMMDANHAYDAGHAIRLGQRVERYDIGWFEEPVVPEDVDGYLQVKQAVRMPIAGGEAEYTRWGFRELTARKAVDILQPDICACGGFTEALRIAAEPGNEGNNLADREPQLRRGRAILRDRRPRPAQRRVLLRRPADDADRPREGRTAAHAHGRPHRATARPRTRPHARPGNPEALQRLTQRRRRSPCVKP